MSKEDIFLKITFKDYNNMLEKVLEQKDFNEDVKNLLLNMLYKIENGYEDYKKVKVNVNNKKDFLQDIIDIIKNDCEKIEIAKSFSTQSNILKKQKVNYIIDEENKKITTYENERIMLEALEKLKQKELVLDEKYNIIKPGLEEILTTGNIMSITEVIRDFNGWSWDITQNQIIDKNINIIYQNLLILFGYDFIQKLLKGEQIEENIEIPNNEILRSKYNDTFGITKNEVKQNEFIDYIEKMKETCIINYGEENTKEFFEQLTKTIIAMECNRNNNQKEKMLQIKEKIKNDLEEMQDNKIYLDKISKIKKEITAQIKQLDKLLNNDELLKEEYKKRNLKLSNESKIFSVSHLKIMLEKERKNKVNKIKEYNKSIEPKEFIKIKMKLQGKNSFFEDIEIIDNIRVNEEKQINKLQEIFLKCLEIKIEKTAEKKELINLIYQIRYYEQLPYKQRKISDEKILKQLLTKIENKIIDKSCKNKILTLFSENIELNQNILNNIFKTKIIDLENVRYLLKYHKGILKIQIYDTNIEENNIEIEILEKVELKVKLNKKTKVIID